jgi:hypothetical protein
MEFDVDKYSGCRFHKDDLIDGKLKALFLWFDYEIYRTDASTEAQLILIDNWIDTFLDEQHYEFIINLKRKRYDIVNGTNLLIAVNLSAPNRRVLFLTKIFTKIKVILKLK